MRLTRLTALFTGRRIVTLADQGVSTVSNFLLAIAVARTVSPREFGIYAILTSLYWISLGSARALIGEPLLIFRREIIDRLGQPEDSTFLAASVGAGFAIGVPMLIVAAALNSPTIAVLGLAMPVLLWQDGIRYVMFAQGRPTLALFADGTWLAAQVVAMAIAYTSIPHVSLSAWLAIWGGSAALACLSTTAVIRTSPIAGRRSEVVQLVRRTSAQLWGDFLVTQGTTQLVIFVLPLVTSLSVVGALKAAQVALGPMSTAMTAGVLFALPSVSELVREGRLADARRRCVELSAAASVAASLYTSVVALLPASVGRALFGHTWPKASHLVVFVGLQSAATGVNLGAQVLLRGTKRTKELLSTRLALSPVGFALPVAGAWLLGLSGLGLALFLSSAAMAVLWWVIADRGTTVPATAAT